MHYLTVNANFFMANKFESPFVFGVRVEGDTFTDRRIETDRLKANFTYGVNTILISPVVWVRLRLSTACARLLVAMIFVLRV